MSELLSVIFGQILTPPIFTYICWSHILTVKYRDIDRDFSSVWRDNGSSARRHRITRSGEDDTENEVRAGQQARTTRAPHWVHTCGAGVRTAWVSEGYCGGLASYPQQIGVVTGLYRVYCVFRVYYVYYARSMLNCPEPVFHNTCTVNCVCTFSDQLQTGKFRTIWKWAGSKL